MNSKDLLIAHGCAEISGVVYDLIVEAQRQGVELPPDFREWISRAVANRTQYILRKLVWHGFHDIVDESVDADALKRDTLIPPKP